MGLRRGGAGGCGELPSGYVLKAELTRFPIDGYEV